MAERRTPFARLAAGLCVLAGLSGVCWPAAAQIGPDTCGQIENAYGPFDYRRDRGETLTRVEIPHFPPEVENLIRGKSGYLGGDIDYTLRAFPNHHRALLAIVKWGEKTKLQQPSTLPRPIECYFERALRFRSDDLIVRMIYATFLVKNERFPEATKQLEYAAALAADNPFTHYNIGLIYFDMKNYDAALHQAHLAYGLGFAQPGLREQLKAAGKWTDAPEAPAGAASASTTSATPAAAAASAASGATR